jgi:predicted cobalt transporter CbtA
VPLSRELPVPITPRGTGFGRMVGNGALAGAAAGGVGAATMYWLVEPSIRAAVAIEGAGSSGTEPAGHSHDAASAHTASAEALVSRGEQVVVGLITVLVVGILIGVAFALVHHFLGPRLPGSSAAGSVMVLAGLGFVAFTLAPALVIPAYPPGVGDPETVNLRTIAYLGTIICAVGLTALVTAAARTRALTSAGRVAAATALGIVGTVVLVWALPDAVDPIPANVPADLIWRFRVGSLAQIGLMWLVLGAVFASLSQRSSNASSRPAFTTSASQLIGA